MAIIFGRYKMGDLIGSGSFGTVYSGKSIKSDCDVAIKVDKDTPHETTFIHEAKLLNYLRGQIFIPVLRYYGTSPDTNTTYLVMNLLGKSLEDIKQERGELSEQRVIHIGIDCIKMLKYIHDKCIIHRDIKPANFLLNLDNNIETLNIIDFGLAKKYVDVDSKHIRIRRDKPIIGTMRYISTNVHNGIESSRRDDLISMIYMLIYLRKGRLPWQGIKSSSHEKYRLVSKSKIDTTTFELCHGLNGCFNSILSYVKKLSFSERPNYTMMETTLKSELFRNSNYSD